MAKQIKPTELHKVLMRINECSLEEANDEITEMKNRVEAGEDPDEVLYEAGLEPDYVMDLLFHVE